MGLLTADHHAEAIFRRHSGVLRTSRALALGIHPRTLYRLRDSGRLVTLGRGVHRLAEAPDPDPGLAALFSGRHRAVLCLLSALQFHKIGTQLPHEVWIALPRGARSPRIEHPPIRVFRFSASSFAEGTEVHQVDGLAVRVYSPAKTVADCFKYRNKVGLDVALEALRETWRDRRASMGEIWRYARVCRVANVMRPYLEAIV